MIPHEEIREKHDHSWTYRLLETIRNSRVQEDLSEVCTTLQKLEDPRVVQPLLQILEDTALPTHMREAASTILGGSCIGLCEDDRRHWWSSSDEILRRHAVLEARTSEAELLVPIASDPDHRFHAEAIRSLQFGFEEPEFQRLSITALSHHDPEVRRAGARNLIWEEPYEAQDALIKALSDESDDVADEALTSISYFSSQKIMRALAELTECAKESRREEIDGVFCKNQHDFEEAYHRLSGDSQAFFHTWLKPVEDLLDLEMEEEEEAAEAEEVVDEVVTLPKYPPDSDSFKILPTAQEIIDHFSDIDRYWQDSCILMFRYDWERLEEATRAVLVSFFQSHEDPSIRELACRPLSLWNRADVLETFLKDPCGGVRKYAACCLQSVTPDPAIASSLWAAYEDINCTGFRAGETLSAFVVHAPKEGLADLLADIALRERRISRKSAAIDELEKLGAHSHLRSLLSLLGEQPLVNWNIHSDLVDYCVSQKLSVPHFAELCGVDDLRLQESLAEAVPYLEPVLLKGLSYAARI